MKKPLVFRRIFEARTVKPARLKTGVDAGKTPERHAPPVTLSAVESAPTPDETRPAQRPDETELPPRVGHGSTVEPALTRDESKLPPVRDETEPQSWVGHGRENRQRKPKVKNQTSLKPAWRASLQAQGAANQ